MAMAAHECRGSIYAAGWAARGSGHSRVISWRERDKGEGMSRTLPCHGKQRKMLGAASQTAQIDLHV